MRLITRRTWQASIYEVFSYGRHHRAYKLTSRIDGLADSQIDMRTGLTRDEAIQAAQDEVDLARIIDTRGCSRECARIHLETERQHARIILNNEWMKLAIIVDNEQIEVRAIVTGDDEANRLCADHHLAVIATDNQDRHYLVDDPKKE